MHEKIVGPKKKEKKKKKKTKKKKKKKPKQRKTHKTRKKRKRAQRRGGRERARDTGKGAGSNPGSEIGLDRGRGARRSRQVRAPRDGFHETSLNRELKAVRPERFSKGDALEAREDMAAPSWSPNAEPVERGQKMKN